jgi:hypothetical protein
MSSFPGSICPLCSQVFTRELLHDHITAEDLRLRENTIKVIQAYYPGWVQDHGACEPRWRSYRDAGRILNIMKCTRPQTAAGNWNPAEFIGKPR